MTKPTKARRLLWGGTDVGERGTCSRCHMRRVVCSVILLEDGRRFQLCREDVSVYV